MGRDNGKAREGFESPDEWLKRTGIKYLGLQKKQNVYGRRGERVRVKEIKYLGEKDGWIMFYSIDGNENSIDVRGDNIFEIVRYGLVKILGTDERPGRYG